MKCWDGDFPSKAGPVEWKESVKNVDASVAALQREVAALYEHVDESLTLVDSETNTLKQQDRALLAYIQQTEELVLEHLTTDPSGHE